MDIVWAVLLQQIIRVIVGSKIAGDAFALDVGIVAVEVNHWVLEVLDGDVVAAKCADAFWMSRLQASQVVFVEDETLQLSIEKGH